MESLGSFLEKYCDDRPLLIALSGGPDSIALFHLLVESKHPFHVAHVDHGWRSESRDEADQLAQLCRDFPFHLKRLDPSEIEGNLEDGCRKARLAFFRELCEAHHLQGVLLGHHADDQAETVLKRVFEGASLPKLRGLAPKVSIGGVTLLRPLLNARKEEILAWLEEKNFSYFSDSTNEDPRFLRVRVRKNLLPTLSQEFGKEVATSLCRLGEAAEELTIFLESLLKVYRDQVIESEYERALDFTQSPPQSLFLWKAVIKDFLDQERVTASRNILETIVSHLEKGSSHVRVKIGRRWVEIHRGKITLKFDSGSIH